MHQFSLASYFRFTCVFSVILWAMYAGFLYISRHKTRLASVQIASICFLFLSGDVVRRLYMLTGILTVRLLPYWETLLLNLPFGLFIYEIFVRKMAVRLVSRWFGIRQRANANNELDGVHSAVRHPPRRSTSL